MAGPEDVGTRSKAGRHEPAVREAADGQWIRSREMASRSPIMPSWMAKSVGCNFFASYFFHFYLSEWN
jgi:hypothetical protein